MFEKATTFMRNLLTKSYLHITIFIHDEMHNKNKAIGTVISIYPITTFNVQTMCLS